ncbi:response regulator [Phormidium tenue FACHB-886]|nr:response regulator [Phormidium tenue FACHB-886]
MCDLTSLRNGLRVLVVDSQLDSCELLAVIFAQHGVETITASCVSEAIEKIQQSPPDLLISEIILPYENGYSLIQQVKTFEMVYSVQIPAIALTVCSEDRDRIQALAAGFCRHLPKPLNIEKLIATVACLTGQTQTISANACQ